MLLERVSSVMVDQTALEALIGLVEGALNGDLAVLDSLNLTSDVASEKGLKLLFVSFHDVILYSMFLCFLVYSTA